MKIKILRVLICVLMLSGCSQKANYDIVKIENRDEENKSKKSESLPEILNPVTDQSELTYVPYQVVNCNESITLRTSPNTAAAEICQIRLGEAVQVIEPAANGFYRIVYQGQEGFSLQQYLEETR